MKTQLKNWECAVDGTWKKLPDGRCAMCGRASATESKKYADQWDKEVRRHRALSPMTVKTTAGQIGIYDAAGSLVANLKNCGEGIGVLLAYFINAYEAKNKSIEVFEAQIRDVAGERYLNWRSLLLKHLDDFLTAIAKAEGK